MPRIAVYSTGRSVAGVLELLKTTTIAHKIADQPTTRVWNVAKAALPQLRRRVTGMPARMCRGHSDRWTAWAVIVDKNDYRQLDLAREHEPARSRRPRKKASRLWWEPA